MQPLKSARYDGLVSLIASLNDDPTRGWQAYPCIDLPYPKHGGYYALIQVPEGRRKEAHLVAYELAYGEIRHGHTVRHYCHMSWCIRPIHFYTEPSANWYYLTETVGGLSEPPDAPWRDYPCLEWPAGEVERQTVWVADGDWHVGSSVLTYRAAYHITKGPIPAGYMVCHHCDNPRCFRPCHLFAGTQQDNLRDCREKGRNTRGSACHVAKLTEDDVRKIRSLVREGRRYMVIAESFHVTKNTIWQIANRRSWKHVHP